jgi:hypothetical protein
MDETKKKMFVFEADKPGRTILWPCPILVPVDNGVDEKMLTARFSLDRVNEDEHTKLWDEANTKADSDRYLLEQILKGFDGVVDDTGTPVADDTMMKLALSKRYIKTGLINGYLMMRSSYLPKNFVTPSASA